MRLVIGGKKMDDDCQPSQQPCQEKAVLVCFGNNETRKREVKFICTTDDGSSDTKDLVKQIGVVFKDVISQEALPQVIVLLKSESLSCEFVEVTGVIPDKSVVKAAIYGNTNQPLLVSNPTKEACSLQVRIRSNILH